MLPVIVSGLLPTITGFLWKAIKRFGSVLFIGLLIWSVYSWGHRTIHRWELGWYNKGKIEAQAICKKDFEQFLKDHPQVTVGAGGTVNQYACEKPFKVVGFYLFGIKIGF